MRTGSYNWSTDAIKEAKRTPGFMAGKKASDIETVIKAIFDKRSFTGWTTGGHTGEDVPVYAYGPSKERFAGLKDNTDHAKDLFEILNLGSPSEDKH